MNQVPYVTILTATYNRGQYIQKLYESLKKQTTYDFEWVIVDDGSTDDTEFVVSSFDKGNFNITYLRKKNGGKHTALNYSHPFINGKVTAIVDSDDYLTEDAIKIIKKNCEIYLENNMYGGITFQRGFSKDRGIDKTISKNKIMTVYMAMNKGLKGDHFEIVRSEEFKKYVFPVFEGEKFVGELPMWISIYAGRKVVYISNVIYLCQYLEGGLTKSGRKMRVNCPNGGLYHAMNLLDKRFNLKIRIKNAILYNCYAKFLNMSLKKIKEREDNVILILTYLPGNLVYKIWKKKYH